MERYVCPTHTDVDVASAGECPYCGQKLLLSSDAEGIE